MGADPVAMGLVRQLNRPEGNITGVSSLNVEVTPKRLEILLEVMPAATMVAVLVNPTSPTAESQVRSLEAVALTRGMQLQVLRASAKRDFDGVFATLLAMRASALLVASDGFFATHSEQLAALTIRHAVPAIHQSRDFTTAGGLMSYGGNFVECAPPDPGSMPDASSRAKSRPSCRSSRSRKSSSSSTSRQLRASASPSRCPSLAAPTRSSNDRLLPSLALARRWLATAGWPLATVAKAQGRGRLPVIRLRAGGASSFRQAAATGRGATLNVTLLWQVRAACPCAGRNGRSRSAPRRLR